MRNDVPLLVIPRSLQRQVQHEAMRLHGDTGNELMFYYLLRRVWMNNREVFQPKMQFVPGPRDYDVYHDEKCALGEAADKKLIRELLKSGTHLFMGHTHPPDGAIGFSQGDLLGNEEASLNLAMLNDSRIMISGVFDHVMSLQKAVYALWHRGHRREIEVIHPEHAIDLQGEDFALVGTQTTGVHHCSNPHRYMQSMLALSPEPPGVWRGNLLPSSGQPELILESTPADQVYIQITGWPIECNCRLRTKIQQPVSLAELGYSSRHPWRSE